jgi:hypothetical protein
MWIEQPSFHDEPQPGLYFLIWVLFVFSCFYLAGLFLQVLSVVCMSLWNFSFCAGILISYFDFQF